jgi:hypothetical protein
MSDKLKQKVKGINNSMTTQLVKLNVQAIGITVGNSSTLGSQDINNQIIDYQDRKAREAHFQQQLKRRQAVPKTLNGAINTLRLLNSYDLCNPFSFAASQIFPPESKVGSEIKKISDFINGLNAAFKGFSIIPGNIDATAVSPNANGQEFVPQGNITLQVKGLDKPIKRGSTVYITQTDDPKIKSQMVGTVENTLNIDLTLPEIEEIPIFDENGNETGEFEEIEVFPDTAIEETGDITYIINIASLSPIEPPYQKTKNGNTVVDEQGEPVLAAFRNFKVTFEKEVTTDTKDLAKEVQEITNLFRELGITEFANDIRDIRSVPGLGKLADLAEKIVKAVNSPIGSINPPIVAVNQQGTEIAQTTGQIATVLEGGLTSGQVFERAAIYNDFYRKLEPFLNFNFTIENLFKKQIESLNSTLRDVIPYDALARLVKAIQDGVKFIVGVISFILVILKAINTVIKICIVIVKVLKAVIKAVRLILKVLSVFVPVAPLIEKLLQIENALQKVIEFLEKISNDLEAVIGKLAYIKRLLKEIVLQLGRLSAKLESCEKLKSTNLPNQILSTTQTAISSYIGMNQFISDDDEAEAAIRDEKFRKYEDDETESFRDNVGVISNNKLTETANGYLLNLRENVFGFDKFGNLVFFGDLISRTTGVNFDTSEAQAFRSGLKYYTFDKFRNNPIVQQLLLEGDRLALENAELSRVVDPEDRFGNYIEKYLGYTLKIAEERPTDKNIQVATRRRGIALDSNERIVATTELTFGDNIAVIVNELKFILKRNLTLGIIGLNTSDKQPNQISDSDTINLAESIGVNKLAINNLKAEANNRAASNIAGQPITSIEGKPVDPNAQIETRIGNQPFTIQEEYTPASSLADKSSPQKSVDVEKLLSQPFNEYIQTNPSLKKITDTIDLLSRSDSKTLSSILSQPGADNFNFEEFTSNLKQSVLSSIDPNPEKVQEVKRKTEQWHEGLKAKTRTDWEIKYGGSSTYQKPPPPPYDVYYDNIEKQELPNWIRLLLRSNYTETEVNTGIASEDIRDKYTIKIDGTKVDVKLRLAFRKGNQ